MRSGGSGMRAARPSRFSLTVPTVKHKVVLHNKVKFTTKVTPSEMGTHAQNASIFCAFSASVASLVANWETPDGPKSHLSLPDFFPERREISIVAQVIANPAIDAAVESGFVDLPQPFSLPATPRVAEVKWLDRARTVTARVVDVPHSLDIEHTIRGTFEQAGYTVDACEWAPHPLVPSILFANTVHLVVRLDAGPELPSDLTHTTPASDGVPAVVLTMPVHVVSEINATDINAPPG